MIEKRTAIITAASRGLGEASARILHNQGYNLVLFSRSNDVQKLATELDVVAVKGDVTQSSDLDRLISETLNKFGRVDVLINNTGHPAKGPLMELNDEEWKSGFELMLLNVIRMSNRVVPHMKSQGSGSIVNISTYAAFEPSAAFPVSSVIRAGLGSYAKLFSDELGPFGIRMNNVLPGFMDSFKVNDETIKNIPLGREASVKEVAEVIAFLASDKSSYVTGQNIRVDGGISKHV